MKCKCGFVGDRDVIAVLNIRMWGLGVAPKGDELPKEAMCPKADVHSSMRTSAEPQDQSLAIEKRSLVKANVKVIWTMSLFLPMTSHRYPPKSLETPNTNEEIEEISPTCRFVAPKDLA